MSYYDSTLVTTRLLQIDVFKDRWKHQNKLLKIAPFIQMTKKRIAEKILLASKWLGNHPLTRITSDSPAVNNLMSLPNGKQHFTAGGEFGKEQLWLKKVCQFVLKRKRHFQMAKAYSEREFGQQSFMFTIIFNPPWWE